MRPSDITNYLQKMERAMGKQYNVFVQWHENTNNYKRFDGGRERVNVRPLNKLFGANKVAADWLYSHSDKYTFTDDGILFNTYKQEIVVDARLPIPMCYDFGGGEIFVTTERA